MNQRPDLLVSARLPIEVVQTRRSFFLERQQSNENHHCYHFSQQVKTTSSAKYNRSATGRQGSLSHSIARTSAPLNRTLH